MKLTEVTNTTQLREFMTTPTEGLVKMMKGLKGDILVLGAAGKVGPELVETLTRANSQAGAKRTFYAVDLFPKGSPVPPERFEELGVKAIAGDLTERAFLDSLPTAPNVVYMVGFKFGSSGDYRRTWHLNAILPYLVGEHFSKSRIVVYSSTNPYPHTRPEDGGSKETDEPDPHGVYGWSIIARESAFATSQLKAPEQRLCFYRLAYAQHLGYGVLVDLARMIWKGEPISLAIPAVNILSQRDAIDISLRALEKCANPPLALNVAGPIIMARDIVEKMAKLMKKKPVFAGEAGDKAFVANDAVCVKMFGPYRDKPDELIEAAARWVMRGGEYWDKPTMFGRADHKY